jgi:hypothetical protein
MSQLQSVELRHESPTSIGLPGIFPAILSTLRTLPWKQLKTLTLIMTSVCEDTQYHKKWDWITYTRQLDELISPHIMARGQQHGLRDIQFWLLKNCKGTRECEKLGPSGVALDPKEQARPLFPLSAAHAACYDYIRLGCRGFHDKWAEEFHTCLVGGWKPVDKEKN